MATESFFSNASLAYLASAGAGKDGKAYSMKPTDGTGDFTFSRGSNLAATRVGANGLIEKGRENLLTYSNDFSQWTKSGVTATSGQSGYDGSSDAWLITKSGGAFDQMLRNVSSSGVNTISFYAKAGTLTSVYFRGQASSNIPDVKFNLSDGSLTSSNNVISASSEDIGSGWYRLKMTFSNTITNVTIYPDFGQTTAGTIYIQDAQLEIGLAATDYIESGATTGKAGLLEDEPRFDYSGGATCPSLLLEPSRTNLLPSEYFGTYNALNGSSITTNYSASPEGYNNATRLQLNSQSLSRIELSAVGTSVANKSHSVSCWVKSNGADAEFRLKCTHSGVLDYHSPNLTATSEWQRFTFTQLFGAGSSNGINAGILNGTSNNAADLSIYGFQLEQDSSYPTSYIPNHSGGTITRGADVCGDAGDVNTFNSTEGVLYAEISALVNGDVDRSIVLSDGTTSNYLRITLHANSNRIAFFSSTGVNYNNFDFSQTDNLKIAFQYKANEWKVYINGILKTQLSALTFSPNTLSDLSFSLVNTSPFYGKTKQVLTFNTALSDADLATLTTI